MKPFEIKVPQKVLTDLQQRLKRTRWPDEIDGADWNYGTNLDYLKSLVDYWQTGYDWREQEAALNQFKHFKADVDGFGIHFIHERGKGPTPMPIIITHGWPGSFYEMLKIIPLLTDPVAHGGNTNDSFDVIIPSLPGFGFSDRPNKPGMSLQRTAELWGSLMTDVLGYSRFAASGTDFGSGVSRLLAAAHPEWLIGLYLPYVGYPHMNADRSNLSEAEQKYLGNVQNWVMREGGYSAIQSTKPQTLGYGLNDSPVGLAGWLIEKFRSLSDSDGDIEKAFTKDELLTNVMIYWVTETINSSIRLYYETITMKPPLQAGQHIEVPVGVGLFPKEANLPPREWVERSLRVKRWTEMPRGGHFAAMEEPELFADDLRAFFHDLKKV